MQPQDVNQAQTPPRRKSKGNYRTKYGFHDPLSIARVIGSLGGTTKMLARALDVNESSVKDWLRKNERLATALKDEKAKADAAVEKSLYQRALGYSHKDVDIRVIEGKLVKTKIVKHYPPDTTACIYWTKNRRPDLWRDVQRLEHTGKDGEKLFNNAEGASLSDLKGELIRRGALTEAGRLVPVEN